jgi:hypothetical protein
MHYPTFLFSNDARASFYLLSYTHHFLHCKETFELILLIKQSFELSFNTSTEKSQGKIHKNHFESLLSNYFEEC